jgi:hypothetical protein
MKLSAITAFLTLGFSALAAPAPQDTTTPDLEAQAVNSPKIPGYDQRQSNNAWAIIKQIKAEKFGKDALTACKAAFATAITESNIYIYANKNVPKSKDYPYDKIGSDHDSVGVFQQRVKYYPLAEAINPAKSAHLFFKKLKTVKDWKKAKTDKQIGVVCQKVQGSGKRLTISPSKLCLGRFANLWLSFGSFPGPLSESYRRGGKDLQGWQDQLIEGPIRWKERAALVMLIAQGSRT